LTDDRKEVGNLKQYIIPVAIAIPFIILFFNIYMADKYTRLTWSNVRKSDRLEYKSKARYYTALLCQGLILISVLWLFVK